LGTPKVRLDVALVERGVTPSRERARALIMAAKVLVDDHVVDKPGTRIPPSATIRLRAPDHPYVSRGGVKLAGAMHDLDVDPRGLRCLDVGGSTGGFTDCLLQHGAVDVVAVDVGTNQLHWKLRTDTRVTVLEQTDIRALTSEQAGAPFPLAVIDVSFISLRLVLGPVAALVQPGGRVLAMLKPQFEVGRQHVGKGGLVRDGEARDRAIAEVREHGRAVGLRPQAAADCRLPGAKKGNVEHFVLFERV
jgi:23S rRNA (cytidine1920-2'-O)/16S rRNA (cytidine1409-2'-O)-methyltransferase